MSLVEHRLEFLVLSYNVKPIIVTYIMYARKKNLIPINQARFMYSCTIY